MPSFNQVSSPCNIEMKLLVTRELSISLQVGFFGGQAFEQTVPRAELMAGIVALEQSDGDINIYPGAVEVCNGFDDDCDDAIDDREAARSEEESQSSAK